ncbi:MAG TPA: carbon-nitrogen hydrolase family protein [Anaerolineae bacterium]
MTDDKRRVRVAAVQMQCALGDKAANLEQVSTLLDSLDERVDIVCLPELFNVGYNLDALGNSLFDLGESIPDGETTQHLLDLARCLDTAIVAGLVEQAPGVTGVLYDTTVLINRQGKVVDHYRKSHLYPAEYHFFRSGDSLPVYELDGLRVGVATCFEAAFPPIFSTLALQGAQIVFNPSAVPVGYGHLQDLRTRARAQDNQFFVVAVNHVGDEGGVVYCGRSQIADPRGEVLAIAADDAAEIIVAELDLALIREQRLQEPVFRGFRPSLYRFSH